jgi:branched-chain amino acid transport system substrate-binding protein
VFIPSFGPEVATMIKQSYELNFQSQFLTYETFYSPKTLEIAGATANGILFCASSFNSNDTLKTQLQNKLKLKYNTDELNYYVASHYDAMMLLLKSIAAGNSTGEEIKNYISNLKTYFGLSGKITFIDNGASEIPLSIYTVKDKNFEIYK